MKKETLITFADVWKEHGTYDSIRKIYASQSKQKEQYLQIFNLLFQKELNYEEVLDELASREDNPLFLSKSQLYRIIESVAFSLLKFDLLYLMNAPIYIAKLDVLVLCSAHLNLKANQLFIRLIQIETEYQGHINYIPPEISKGILKTRDGTRIEEIIRQLKSLNLTPTMPIFESISYSNGKIYFKFYPEISNTIIFYSCIQKAFA